MTTHTTRYKPKMSKIIFLLSILVAVFWLIGQWTNVYHFAFVGAIYEILWLPMLTLLFLLPLLSIFFLFREKFNARSPYIYSLLVLAIAALLYKLL
jgi:hypothetical protein